LGRSEVRIAASFHFLSIGLLEQPARENVIQGHLQVGGGKVSKLRYQNNKQDELVFFSSHTPIIIIVNTVWSQSGKHSVTSAKSLSIHLKMHHWKAYAFVLFISILPLIIILPFLLPLTGWPRSPILALLTTYGLGYVYLLETYTLPFLATPTSITNLPKPPHVRFAYASGLDLLSRPPGCM